MKYDRMVSLRIAALGLLAQEPGSGYDLLKHFEKSMANVWPATQSQLYGELNKLADAELIEVSAIGPRGRKEYRITEAGRTELRRWVANPGDDPKFRSAELLRVFLLGEIPRKQAREHMVTVAQHADAEVKRLEELSNSIDWGDDEGSFYGRAALEYGLRLYAMEADWARWLAKGNRHTRAQVVPGDDRTKEHNMNTKHNRKKSVIAALGAAVVGAALPAVLFAGAGTARAAATLNTTVTRWALRPCPLPAVASIISTPSTEHDHHALIVWLHRDRFRYIVDVSEAHSASPSKRKEHQT